MKKIITSAGLVALGAASLNAADGLSRIESSKFWTASITLRGFYDDNINTVPKSLKESSYGFEVRPSITLNFPLEQTFLSLGYTYDLRYYFDRDPKNDDQSHEVNFKLDHAFNERFRVQASDNLSIFQEPNVFDGTTPTRTDGDNLHNRGSIDFTGQLTELMGLNIGYANNLWDYDAEGVGSRSALLDRDEHLAHIDLRWNLTPELVGLIGYQFGFNDYDGKEAMFFDPFTGAKVTSDDKDSYNHYMYVGADYKLSTQLSAAARVGAQYTDYRNIDGHNDWSPYVDASLTYTYLPGSTVQGGVRHSRIATDQSTAISAQDFTLDQEATTFYLAVNHKITAQLTGNLLLQYQNAEFHGGFADDERDNIYMVGLNLDYKFNPHWGVEAGYNWDYLDTDVGDRRYHRNRVYLGLRATY